MWLPPRLAWQRRRLRNQPVPRRGRPLSNRELYLLDRAWFALIDEDGTRRVAVAERDMSAFAAEVLAGGDAG
jgi:hypothetical protein